MQAVRARLAGRAGVIALITLVFVTIADRLFYLHPLGWTPGLFAGLLTFVIVLRRLASARRRSNEWLVGVNAVAAFITLFAICLVDVNGGIARFNVRHCREFTNTGVLLDVDYLWSLGPASLPALYEVAARCELQGAHARQAIVHLEVELARDVADWRGWTWRRARLVAALEDQESQRTVRR